MLKNDSIMYTIFMTLLLSVNLCYYFRSLSTICVFCMTRYSNTIISDTVYRKYVLNGLQKYSCAMYNNIQEHY